MFLSMHVYKNKSINVIVIFFIVQLNLQKAKNKTILSKNKLI